MRRRAILGIDSREFLDALGITYHRSGTELRCDCPNPEHPKRPGPGSVQIVASGPRAGLWTCFSCGAGGGPVSFVSFVLGLSYREARAWLRGQVKGNADVSSSWVIKEPASRRLSVPLPEQSTPLWGPISSKEIATARAYVLGRGFTESELELFAIHAVPKGAPKYSERVVFPVVVYGRCVDFVARLYVKKSVSVPKALSGRRDEGAQKERALWGYDFLDRSNDVVHVVEGVWGAIAAIHAGVPNVVAACGSAWSEERTSLLTDFRRIVLIPDADKAGKKFVAHASSLRFEHDVTVAELPDRAQPDTVSDDDLLESIQLARPARFGVGFGTARLSAWEGKS